MIFSEHSRSKRKSHRRSRMRRRARSGVAYLSGFVVLSLAALSLVLANLPSRYDATRDYVSTFSQPQQQPDVSNKAREQRILDQTLAKLEASKTAAVEKEHDIRDSGIDYSEADAEPEREPIIAGGEIDQAIPATDPADDEPGEGVLAQKPAVQPQLQGGPPSPSGPSAGPSVPAYPGSAPNSAAPDGPSFPQVAGSPRTPDNGSPIGRPSTPQNSIPGISGGGGGGAPETPSTPNIAANEPSSGPGDSNPPPATGSTPDYTPSRQIPGPTVADNPGTSQPTIDNTPSGSPIDLPSELSGPRIGDASDPTDGWFSPGHSPGIATVAGDFDLNRQTILFEILGTEPGRGYDQLQVGGKANLNEGNIVFAFINGYVPTASDLYDLILGQEILVDLAKVKFYYGLFDSSYDLHAPHNLGLYTALNYLDGDPDDVKLYETGNRSVSNDNGMLTFDQLMQISYAYIVDQQVVRNSGPSETFIPIAFNVPEPAPLLLLAFGLVLLRRFGKGRTG